MFKTKEDIEKYLDSEKLECLECGKLYKQLGNHLLRKHTMTVDDYKDKYGLPYSRGLVGTTLSKTLSDGMKSRIENGEFIPDIDKMNTSKRELNNKPRHSQPFIKAHLKELNIY